MQINLNIRKSYLVILIAVITLAFGIGYVVAYGTLTPSTMGHTLGEIELDCERPMTSGSGSSEQLCSGGYKLFSGGCHALTTNLLKSIPNDAKNGWACISGGGTVRAYAYCCR